MPLLLALLLLLGHDRFTVREAAHATLNRLSPLLWPMLDELGRKHPCQEVATRCRMLSRSGWNKMPLELRLEITAKLRPRGWRQLPWATLSIYNAYFDVASKTPLSQGGPEYEMWRECTRLMVVDMTAHGAMPEEIMAVLEQLVLGDMCWWRAESRCVRRWQR